MMGESKHPSQAHALGAFPTSEAFWRTRTKQSQDKLSLQDINEIRLLLRGQSVVDWHRLALSHESEVRRLLALNSIDIDDDRDVRRLEQLRSQAVRYVRDTLRLRIDETIATEVPWLQLPLLASTIESPYQAQACMLLKVMHVIYHLDARELRTMLAISEHEIYALVERSVAVIFDELQTSGVPVVEFSWSRKSRESLITKLLVKRETSAARVFDRLRFRIVVSNPSDLVPTLHIMLQRCIPFNYIVPTQTVNTLIDPQQLSVVYGPMDEFDVDREDSQHRVSNEFSGSNFRILNFVADLPIRVHSLLPPEQQSVETYGHVVFVLAEFQIMDKQTAKANEKGENSHMQYKHRQHQRVRLRLLQRPRNEKNETSDKA